MKEFKNGCRAGSWEGPVGCDKKWVEEWGRDQEHKRRMLGKAATDWMAGFLFAEDRLQLLSWPPLGWLSGTNKHLMPSQLPMFLRHCPGAFSPFPSLWNWSPGSICLGYSMCSVTNTPLSSSNLHKMWFRELIQKSLNVHAVHAFFGYFTNVRIGIMCTETNRTTVKTIILCKPTSSVRVKKEPMIWYSIFLRKGT